MLLKSISICLCLTDIMQVDAIDRQIRLFQSLSSVPRMRILNLLLLTEKPVHIKGISRTLKLDYAATYRHIENLKKANLISIYEVGRSRVPYVNRKSEVKALIEATTKLI